MIEAFSSFLIGLLIAIGVGIITLIIILLSTKKKSSKTVNNQRQPAQTSSSNTTKKQIDPWSFRAVLGRILIWLTIFGGITFIIWFTVNYIGFGEKTTPDPNSSVTKKELVFQGVTPCDPVINFKFSIETDGNPINERFSGTSEDFLFDGKNDRGTPSGAIGGPVHITSANPDKPHVTVRVYKILN
jgi:hypothetical protein